MAETPLMEAGTLGAKLKNLGQTFRHFSREDLAISAPVVALAAAYLPVLFTHTSSPVSAAVNGAISTACILMGGFQLHKGWREARRACAAQTSGQATPCQDLAR